MQAEDGEAEATTDIGQAMPQITIFYSFHSTNEVERTHGQSVCSNNENQKKWPKHIILMRCDVIRIE